MRKIETKTVREVAEILGVTKQAVFKRINQLPPEFTPKKVNGMYKLSPQIVDYIIKNSQSTTSEPTWLPTDNQPVDSEFATLNAIIKDLKSDKTHLNEYIKENKKELKKKNETLISYKSGEEMSEAIKLLLEQKNIEVKRMEVELAEKNKQIEKLHSLVDQQQQLALQTQLQNNKLQLQLEEVESKVEAEKEVESDAKQSNKKWWHFFK